MFSSDLFELREAGFWNGTFFRRLDAEIIGQSKQLYQQTLKLSFPFGKVLLCRLSPRFRSIKKDGEFIRD